tara:strand:+ start:841 stop:2307 length:1467 start_codon:yes stop_codon:yes gene_type:complete
MASFAESLENLKVTMKGLNASMETLSNSMKGILAINTKMLPALTQFNDSQRIGVKQRKAMLEIMEKTNPVIAKTTVIIKAQSKAMNDAGESAKNTTEDMKNNLTFIGKILGDSNTGFMRKTTGGVGFFHRMMYGVDGYFIFKNRLDGVLSFVDRTIVRPLSGKSKKGELGFFGGLLKGFGEDVRAVDEGKGKTGKLFNSIFGDIGSKDKGKGLKGVKKFIHFGARFFRIGLSVVSVFAKYLVFIGLFFASIFIQFKVLKSLGVDFKDIKRIAIDSFKLFLAFGKAFYENIKEIIGGFKMIFDSIFGDYTLSESLVLFVKGYGHVILGFFKGVFNLLAAIISPILFGYIMILKEILFELKDKIIEKLAGPIQKVKDKSTAMRMKRTQITNDMIGGFRGPLGGRFASGGVTRGGVSLVGELGPELIRLPRGTRVHSNAESKAMMGGNNITVNIQGRIGASDSELRQIAQKVGQMINKEINRTTSSRGLGA